MSNGEEDFSMIVETVKTHERRITHLEERDEKREEFDKHHEERIKSLEDGSVKLENTIMIENRDTRKTMTEQTAKLFDIVQQSLGFQSTRTSQAHEYKVLKWNTVSSIVLKVGTGIFGLLGSGGILWLAVQKFILE